jgi:hypothetical protein
MAAKTNVEISEYIQDMKISSYTSILSNFTNFQLLVKSSGSNSIVFYATFDDRTFFFKVFPIGTIIDGNNSRIHKTTNLLFEKIYYEELFKLVKYNITPNILCKVTTSDIPNFDTEFIYKQAPHLQKSIISQINESNDIEDIPQDTLWKNTGVIITLSGGDIFEDIYRALPPEDFKKVMFQILYTLYVFEKIEFSHGDLHSKNIFVLTVPETQLCYFVNNRFYKFKTKKLVKIYDFDHSTICKTTEISINRSTSITINQNKNPIREPGSISNNRYGETNIFNKNLDIVMFYLLLDYNDPDFLSFYYTCFPGLKSTETITVPDTDLDMQWNTYFQTIKGPRYNGHIIKSFKRGGIVNNHLIIPESIIIPKVNMIFHNYFNNLIATEEINIRTEIVYSIF